MKNAGTGETVATVVLNKDNNWSATQKLTCKIDDQEVKYTVEYARSGTNVTGAGGTTTFSGEGSKVDIVGVFREVSATRMSVQLVAEGLKGSNNGQSQWHVNMDEGARATNDINYKFNPSELRGQVTSTVLTNMRLTDNNGNKLTYRIKVYPQECQGGAITVTSPSGQVLTTETFSGPQDFTFDLPAEAGTFVIKVTGNGASTNQVAASAKKSPLRAANAPGPTLAANGSTEATFSDDITHSRIQLPADAEAVGDPVTLRYSELAADSWHYKWGQLPVCDSDGNPYHYYIKEVSATTDGNVASIGAAYEYENLSQTDDRIHKVTITNTTTVKEVDIAVKKISAKDESPLQNAGFTLRKKAGPGSTGGETPVFNGYEDVKSGANGIVHFTGLTPGDYVLTEDTAPAGFNRFAQQIEFTIGADGKVANFDSGQYSGNVTLSADGFTFTVKDEPGYALPSTGGSGTESLTLLALLMLATAMLMLARRRIVFPRGLSSWAQASKPVEPKAPFGARYASAYQPRKPR